MVCKFIESACLGGGGIFLNHVDWKSWQKPVETNRSRSYILSPPPLPPVIFLEVPTYFPNTKKTHDFL